MQNESTANRSFFMCASERALTVSDSRAEATYFAGVKIGSLAVSPTASRYLLGAFRHLIWCQDCGYFLATKPCLKEKIPLATSIVVECRASG